VQCLPLIPTKSATTESAEIVLMTSIEGSLSPEGVFLGSIQSCVVEFLEVVIAIELTVVIVLGIHTLILRNK